MFFANGADFIHLGGRSIQMNKHHKAHIGEFFKGLLEGDRVYVPGIALAVDKHGLAVLVSDRVERRGKGHVAAKDLSPLQHTLTHLGHSIQSHASKARTQVQRSCSRRKCHSVLHADLLGNQAFQFVDVCTNGTHPVRLVRLGDILDFVTVHRGARKPNFLFKAHKHPVI